MNFKTLGGFLLLAGTSVWAQQADSVKPKRVSDCTNATIEEHQDGVLTREEEIALMEGTLLDSVDRYDTCIGEAQAAGGGGGGGAGGGAGSGSGSGASGEGQAQTAEANEESQESSESEQEPLQSELTQPPRDVNGTGGVPEDIPPADNDTVLQKQIRKAAEAETDPQKRAELWELYRKYKKG